MSEVMILRWLVPALAAQAPSTAVIIGPRGLQGNANRITFTIGDGVSTSFLLDHDFNDLNVGVWVYRNDGAERLNVIPDIGRPGVNQVRLTFAVAPAIDEFCVIVMMAG